MTEMLRPARMKRFHEIYGHRTVFRHRNDNRWLVFLPFVVLKTSRSGFGREMIDREGAGGLGAARSPFWRDIAAPMVRLGPLGLMGRKYRHIRLEDFDAVAALMEDRLREARNYPTRPIIAHVAGRGTFARLAAREREHLGAALSRYDLPCTASHGDLHFFNFVRSADGFKLIDWDAFDPDGSFVYDYIDFHLSLHHANRPAPWSDVLGRLTPEERAIRRAAAIFDVDPRVLLAHYLVTKADVIAGSTGRQAGSWLRNAIRRALATFGGAGLCSETTYVGWTAAFGL